MTRRTSVERMTSNNLRAFRIERVERDRLNLLCCHVLSVNTLAKVNSCNHLCKPSFSPKLSYVYPSAL